MARPTTHEGHDCKYLKAVYVFEAPVRLWHWLHTFSFLVLATARLLEGNPQKLALIGVQPHTLDDFGGSLTPLVRDRVAAAAAAAVQVLEGWGSVPVPRRKPLSEADLTGPGALERAAYEQRPTGEPR